MIDERLEFVRGGAERIEMVKRNRVDPGAVDEALRPMKASMEEASQPLGSLKSHRLAYNRCMRRRSMMKGRAIWAAIMALASGSAAWAAESSGVTPPMQTPVVVELFQSQGCSDCPPAQENLNRLADRPDVLALSYGVTYWDYLGWKDSFASPQFTQRQRDYSARNHDIGVATPQYWINGRQTVLGANSSRVSQLIDQGSPTGGPSLTVVGSNLNIASGIGPPGGADIWLVHYDPRTIQVAVRAGENGGRTIPHRDVVRELIRIGRWSGTPETIALPAAAGVDGLKSAVLIQAGPGGPIVAAVKI